MTSPSTCYSDTWLNLICPFNPSIFSQQKWAQTSHNVLTVLSFSLFCSRTNIFFTDVRIIPLSNHTVPSPADTAFIQNTIVEVLLLKAIVHDEFSAPLGGCTSEYQWLTQASLLSLFHSLSAPILRNTFKEKTKTGWFKPPWSCWSPPEFSCLCHI